MRASKEPLSTAKEAAEVPLPVNLPSWVPDFHARLEPLSLTQHYYTDCFSASKDMEAIPLSIDSISNYLTVHGFIFDTVACTSESGHELMQTNSIVRILLIIMEVCAHYGTAYPTGDHPFEALWKTMAILTDTTGEKDLAYPPPPAIRQTFADWILYVLALPRALPGKQNLHQSAQDNILSINLDSAGLLPHLETVKLEAEALRLYLSAKAHRNGVQSTLLAGQKSGDDLPLTFKPTGDGHPGMAAASFGDTGLMRMRLYRTKENYYIGKGPQSVEVGDEICIIQGAQVPFILRRIPGTERRKFVGQTYVHGVMHGEISNRWMGCVPQEFIIE
jgi:hypothetical protein